ncbi:MAG: AMP-dependent synthetase and ligase [Actinomycetia bacterium]|nr:AMP-dependent synthetase and ligase [Actinomycetes bacterium]
MALGFPDIPGSAGDLLDVAVARHPEREALVASDGRFTYRELDDAVDRAAVALSALGVRRGDVLAVSLPNASDVVVTFHAAMRLGAVWLGINRNLAPPEKQFMLDDAGSCILLADAHVAAALSDGRASSGRTRVVTVSPDPKSTWQQLTRDAGTSYERVVSDPTDPAGIAYTSGTTGRPKGVVHSHRNILLPGAMLIAARGFGPELRKGDCAALTILNMQVTATLLVAQAQATQVVMDRLDPPGIAAWVRRERVTSWFGVPTLLHGLTESAEAGDISDGDLDSLVDVWSGGTYVPAPIRAAFERRFGIRVHATYGLTEAPTVVTIEPRDEPHVPGGNGTALPHLCVEVRDDEGAVLPVGHVGEITVRAQEQGPWKDCYSPMVRYHHQPEASAKTLRDGVLYTGDIGELDPAGNLFVHDRRNALILRGGANVYPAEVERVLLDSSDVVGAAVIGISDERLGQRVAAAVELRPGATASVEELAEHCRRNLAKYKVPEQWLVGVLPRNAMGKVSRVDVARFFER